MHILRQDEKKYKKVKIHFCQFHASPYPSSTFEIKSLDQKKKSLGLEIMCVQDFFDSEFLQKISL